MSRKYEVIWSKAAQADLARIIEYIARDCPPDARKILARIKGRAVTLYRSPQRGRVVQELLEQGIAQYRELIVGPWRLMYRITDSTVNVLSVLDARQNVEDILLNRLTNP